MNNRDSIRIGDIYGKMLNSLRHTLKESEAKTFPGVKVELVGDGPHVSGYNEVDGEYTGKKGTKKNKGKRLNPTKAVHDEDEETAPTKSEKNRTTLKEKLKNPDLTTKQRENLKNELARMEKSAQSLDESKKVTNKTLNNFMSKSVFDKLYNKVLRENFGQDEGDDLDALGLDDATADSEMGDDFSGEEEGGGDEVTFTLPREVAQQLIDVLQASIGGGEEEGFGDEDGGDDLDFGDEGGDEFGGDEDHYGEEDEEQGTKPLPNPGKAKALEAKSNQVAGPPKPKHTKASSKVTDTVGTTETAPPITALQGKNNQVPSAVKVGDYFK